MEKIAIYPRTIKESKNYFLTPEEIKEKYVHNLSSTSGDIQKEIDKVNYALENVK